MYSDNYMLIDMYLGRAAVGDIETIERSMITLRRSQRRRTLARLSGALPSATFEVIDVIEAAELAGQPATVSAVADALSIDQPRASKLVAAAVDAGLVERHADQADGRRSFLARTPAGVEVTEQVHSFRRRLIGSALSSWDNSDVSDFARLLNRFITDFAAVTR
jgi:DNA-binding MarR family transcriptional regulator